MTYEAYINKKLPNKTGTMDYTELNNKPSINNVELSGNKTTTDLSVSYEDLINKPTITPELSLVNSPAWGGIMLAGSITPSVTLPAFGTITTSQTFVYSFIAASSGATFTAPNDAMVVDSEGTDTYTAGNSLVYSDLVEGSLYECNFSCYTANSGENYIVLVMKGYPAA